MHKPKVVNAIQELKKAHPKKMALPAKVIEAARPESSPLHSYFCWDDTKAAHQFRLSQARDLLASIDVVYEGSADPVPLFVSLASDRKAGGGYREINDVMSSDELRDEMLQTALKDIEAIQFRYKRLKEFSRVFAEFEKVKKTVQRKKSA